MSTLAVDTGLLLIDGITITFEDYFPAEDRPEFSRARINLINALRTFEETSEFRFPQEKQEAHNQVELRLNELLNFFDNGTPSQIVFDSIFCYLYNQITRTLDNFENLLNIHARKQYLLADLFEIPMDDVHGRFYEYRVTPKSHYTERVLNALLTRTERNSYSNAVVNELQIGNKLRLTINSTNNVISQLERLYDCFARTAARYQITTDVLITQLLEKKKRNATVHVGRDLVDHYDKCQQLRRKCNLLISNNPDTKKAAEEEFDLLIGENSRNRITQALQAPIAQQGVANANVIENEIRPKLQRYLNSPQFVTMQTLFNNGEIDRLEKMFTHYCKFKIEKWYF